MKVTKITHAQLQEIIREQAVKYKRALELQKKKEEIVKQLNEMYGENAYGAGSAGEVDEIFGLEKTKLGQNLGMKTPEQKAQDIQAKGIQTINNKPAFKQMYAGFLKTNPQQAEKMVQYLGEHPDAKGIKWNPERNEFADINDVITGSLLQKMAAGTGGLTAGGGVGTKPKE